MYLRCPWSLTVAVALTVAWSIVATIKYSSGDVSDTMMSTTITVAAGGAWLWWGIRWHDARRRESKVDDEIEKMISDWRSQ